MSQAAVPKPEDFVASEFKGKARAFYNDVKAEGETVVGQIDDKPTTSRDPMHGNVPRLVVASGLVSEAILVWHCIQCSTQVSQMLGT